MARIRIHAAGGSGAAEDGNNEPLLFTASLTDHGGDPVKHLQMKAFDLQAFIVGPGGTGFHLASTAEPAPGVYVLEVLPQRRWNDGDTSSC